MMTRCTLALLCVSLIACGEDKTPAAPKRLIRPTHTVSVGDHSYLLDTSRSAVFLFDAEEKDFVAARKPTTQGIAIPFADFSRVYHHDLQVSGMAVDATETALAVAYSFGFGPRQALLSIIPLKPFPLPVEPARQNVTIHPAAAGPFATPEGKFLIIAPGTTGTATWSVYPGETSIAAAPAQRVVFSADGQRVYALDATANAVHVLSWPELLPLADVSTPTAPVDIAIHPSTESLLVAATTELRLYRPYPSLLPALSAPSQGFPWRVKFSRYHQGVLFAVLYQDATLRFYDTATLCGVDTAPGSFQAKEVAFFDEGTISDPRLRAVTPAGCASAIPDQAWALEYEGLLAAGSALASETNVIAGRDWATFGVAVGDELLVAGMGATVTAVSGDRLYYAPLTEPPAAGTPVEYAVRARGAWVLTGRISGLLGRAITGVPFTSHLLNFTIEAGQNPPTRGDRFTFFTANGITPVALGGAGFDLAEDILGRFLVPLPNSGIVRAVQVRTAMEGGWSFRTLYTID